jgi:hypothetical protein
MYNKGFLTHQGKIFNRIPIGLSPNDHFLILDEI